ncbi:alpha-amylase family glycosyl hydrolase [Haloarcula sp. S1AR25-5A]|uniref:Alpha-amylase family glycosyl hydrolase n=1 Tax=Haloarcula terrestris TaxID=2950533 RepID=A0AAE4EWD6_9EURY|nr:alpha-amylase family glycosyl hydrolase [Haloarcula terrestris]MDS0219943.1 alpha-amylase family glycosyl hydrolase [Haloarcula terrestris]
MHHPGPPRFVAVGESVELAPRQPDPDMAAEWRLHERPAASTAALSDGPVCHLEPDAPGTYRAELTAPDGTHEQVVRAFPAVTETARFSVTEDDFGHDDLTVADRAIVIGTFNDFTTGTHWAERDGDEWVIETDLPPGTHHAIFSFDGSFEATATDAVTVDGPGRPRVELTGETVGDDLVVTADARAAPSGSEPEVEFHLDGRDALAASAVTIDGDELRVPRDALPETARIHAVTVAERHSVADTLVVERDGGIGDRETVTGDTVTVSRPADPPAWTGDATIYEIFVRSFAGETVDTTFEAIERRVPYIESLGVDVVWLTPVQASPTRHGYHITDFFDTATDLGTRAAFESLVDRLNDAGIRVVFDLVINHSSRDHPAFQLHQAGVPEYADYYERIPAEQDISGVDWAGEDAPGHYFNWTRIPNLNYDSLAVRRWMLDVVEEWHDLVDGFRCDVAWGVPHGFWKEVRERVKADDSEFLLLDETVPRNAAFAENEFDMHYDTDLFDALRDIGTGEAPASALFEALDATVEHGYPDRTAHMRYVDNHDENRYIDHCGAAPLRAAVGATFTLPGTPMIYAGQERGVEKQRGTMRWHDGDNALTDFHRQLVDLRADHAALRAHGVRPIPHTTEAGDSEAVVAYERTDGDETLVVVLHFGEGTAAVSLDAPVEDTDLLSGDRVEVDGLVEVGDVVVVPAARNR